MMKNQKKITRVRLLIDNEDNSILLGLVSAEPDYKLSLSIKQMMGIALKTIAALSLITEEENEVQFSRFTGTESGTDRTFTLVSNRSGKHYLIRKLKNIDYLIYIHDPEGIENPAQLTESLKKIPVVTALFKLDPNTIKDKNLDLVIQ
jgi:hypothetical protein